MVKILAIPGDDVSDYCVRSAVDIMTLMVPDLNVEFAEFGRTSWERTDEVLPPETEDAIAESTHVLCGSANVSGIGKKDPVQTIISYNNLFVRVTDYVKLPRVGTRDFTASIAVPVHTILRQIKEIDSLDGIESAYTMSTDDADALYEMCIDLAKIRKHGNLTLVTNRELFPATAKLEEDEFNERVNDYSSRKKINSVASKCVSGSEAAAMLATATGDLGLFIGDSITGTFLNGAAIGASSDFGLMGDTYIGRDLSLYTPPLDLAEKRRGNPTATLLAACSLLTDIGHAEEANLIIKAIQDAYLQRAVPPDVFGSKTAYDFITHVVEYLNTVPN